MGRPRSFDVDEALDRAMHVFWHKGYEGTSLSDLTEAMGVNRPSLYAAFGGKESLFRKALDRYAEHPSSYVDEALEEPTARRVAEHMLEGALDLQTHPHTPLGCLFVQGALAVGEEAAPVRQEVTARRTAGESAIRERFERAIAEGDLPPGTDAAALARYIRTVVYGMAVQAADGASREELRKVAAIALKAWPD
jgi:AcrR family transcriptional regulator